MGGIGTGPRTTPRDESVAPPPAASTGGLGWRRLQATAAIVAIASLVIPMILDGGIEGFLLGMAAPFALGLLLGRWLPRTAAIFLGLVSLAILLASAPFLVQALAHPEALADFLSSAGLTLATIVAVVAAVPAYREAGGRRPTTAKVRAVGLAAVAVGVVASGVSFVAAAAVKDVAAQLGDLKLRTENFVFAPAEVTAEAGAVSVHLVNDDSTRHTFTIDGLVDVSVPPNSTQRATFTAEPGTYRFYCIPHAPGMDGQLVVK